MTNVSITELKSNPALAINSSFDYPVAVMNRSKTQAYLIGKTLFERMVAFIEDYIDKKAVDEADYKKGTKMEDLMKELGLE